MASKSIKFSILALMLFFLIAFTQCDHEVPKATYSYGSIVGYVIVDFIEDESTSDLYEALIDGQKVKCPFKILAAKYQTRTEHGLKNPTVIIGDVNLSFTKNGELFEYRIYRQSRASRPSGTKGVVIYFDILLLKSADSHREVPELSESELQSMFDNIAEYKITNK